MSTQPYCLREFGNSARVWGGVCGEVSEVPHLGYTVRGTEDEVRQLCPWEVIQTLGKANIP